MIINTNVKAPFADVKRAFVSRTSGLLKYLLPIGVKVSHYKGIRRGATIGLKIPFSGDVSFKVVTYATSARQVIFNDILKEGSLFGLKFLSHRHTIRKHNDHTLIRDEITFTSKNKIRDKFLYCFFLLYFFIRALKYKLYFWRQQ